MQVRLSLVVSVLFALSATPSLAADAISVEPNPARPGELVTFRWYFTGRKVVWSGGHFGKGTVVTGRTSVTDRPTRTTRYSLDVWYVPDASGSKAAQAAGKTNHSHYDLVVRVEPLAAGLQQYRNPRGWSVAYRRGWKCDAVPLTDPARNALVYFQQQDDSVERLAVSILPADDTSVADLTRKVEISLPTHYEDIKVESRVETAFAGVPAIMTTFSGKDLSHDGARTESVVLTFVRDALGYVVSARAAAAQFPGRRQALEAMVRSFRPATVLASHAMAPPAP